MGNIELSDNNAFTFSNIDGLGVKGIGDPFMLKVSPTEYYMYCTNSDSGLSVWASSDMVNWEMKGEIYSKDQDGAWGYQNFWAPEVFVKDGKYYLIYTARYEKDRLLKIGLAVSDSPAGPFTDVVKGEPFLNPTKAVIDGDVFADEDGSMYMYFVLDCSTNTVNGINTSQVYGVKLKDDLTGMDGTPVLLTTPDQQWEIETGNYVWNEGPIVIKHDATYYLVYSSSCYDNPAYSLGYATSDSPLGPFTKAEENPVLTAVGLENVSGSGHNNFVLSPDGTEIWASYHTHTNVKQPSGDRQCNLCRIGFTDDGKLYFNGPLVTEQPKPSGNGITNITGSFNATAEKTECKLLTDGAILVHAEGRYATDYELSKGLSLPVNESGVINIEMNDNTENDDPAKNISGIAIYPGSGSIHDIYSVKLKLDDATTTEYILPADATAPLCLSFTGTPAKSVTVILTPSEGTNSITLSEIELFSGDCAAVNGDVE
ncbi:MAG: glycoside hydrolase family 43 protein [Acetatifactor sp.]|nr:glycoside hydrolase family 43 protein [Acetatifactor sp.]